MIFKFGFELATPHSRIIIINYDYRNGESFYKKFKLFYLPISQLSPVKPDWQAWWEAILLE